MASKPGFWKKGVAYASEEYRTYNRERMCRYRNDGYAVQEIVWELRNRTPQYVRAMAEDEREKFLAELQSDDVSALDDALRRSLASWNLLMAEALDW